MPSPKRSRPDARLQLLALLVLTATAGKQVVGFIPPEDVEAAGAWMDACEKLEGNLNALVDQCLDYNKAHLSFKTNPAPGAADGASARAAEKRLTECLKRARARAAFADRTVVQKAEAVANGTVFKLYAQDNLGWTPEEFSKWCVERVEGIFSAQDRLDDAFPLEPQVGAPYSLSQHGGERVMDGAVGAPSIAFFEEDLAELDEAPRGQKKFVYLQMQGLYGCGITAIKDALYRYRCDKAAQKFSDVDVGEVGAAWGKRIHRDKDGARLIVPSEDDLAATIESIRVAWPLIGISLMTKEVKLCKPSWFVSHYAVERLFHERDASRRVKFREVLVRSHVWSPYSNFSWHLDGNEAAIDIGVTVSVRFERMRRTPTRPGESSS